MVTRGCGIVLYDSSKDSVLVFRRDNKNWIPFPDMLDLLGGQVEDGETPEAAIVREVAEEIIDLRTGQSYVLEQPQPFLVYTDARGCEQSIFVCDANLDIPDLHLLEGNELIWVSRKEVEHGLKMAFEFEAVLRQFFAQRFVEVQSDLKRTAT